MLKAKSANAAKKQLLSQVDKQHIIEDALFSPEDIRIIDYICSNRIKGSVYDQDAHDFLQEMSTRFWWMEGVDYFNFDDLCVKLKETPQYKRCKLRLNEWDEVLKAVMENGSLLLEKLLDEYHIVPNEFDALTLSLALNLIPVANILIQRGWTSSSFSPEKIVYGLLEDDPEQNEETIFFLLERTKTFHTNIFPIQLVAIENDASLGIIYLLLERGFDPRFENKKFRRLAGEETNAYTALINEIRNEQKIAQGYDTSNLNYLKAIQEMYDDFITAHQFEEVPKQVSENYYQSR